MAFNFDQIKNRAKSLDAQNTSVDRSLTPTAPKVTAPTVAPTPQVGPSMSPWNVPMVSPGTKRAKEEERKAIVKNKWYENYNLTLPGGIGKAYAQSNPEIAQNAVAETNQFIERAGSSGLAGRGLGTLEGMIPSTLNQLERTLGQPLNREPITTPIAEDWNSSPGKIWQTVKEQASNPFNQGLLGGTAIQYGLTGGVGIEKAILSGAGKVTAKTALGRGASNLGRVAGANAVGGLPINTVMSMDETSMMENATGGDFAKSMAINTALDIVLGGAIEGISGLARLRRYSKAKQDEVIEKVAQQLQLPVAEVKLLTGPVQGQADFFGSATGLSKNINEADVRQLPAPADVPVKTSNATTKPLAKKVDSDFYTNPGGQTAKDIQTADIKGLPEPKAETKSRTNVFAYVDKPGVDKVKAKSDAYRAIKEATGIKDGEGNKVLTEALRKIDTNEKDGWDTPEFWNDIMDVMKKQEHSKVDPEETFPGLKKEIRETKIRISDDLKQMVDFNDLRKKSMGKVTLSKKGRPIDELYGEWSEMHPGLFPDSITHPTAQLEKILEVSDSLKPTTKTIGDVMSDDDLWDGPLTQVWKAINDYRRTVKEDVSYGKGQKEVPTTATRGELSGDVKARTLPTKAKPKKELPKRLPKKEADIYAGAKGQKEVPKTVVPSEVSAKAPKSAVQPPKSESQPVAPPKKETPKTEPKMEVKNAESKRDTVPTKTRKLDPKTERVLEKLNNRLRERGEDGDNFYEVIDHPKKNEIKVLADLFKSDVITVKPLKEVADTFHGVHIEGEDVIAINLSKTTNPAHVVYGHEVMHQVQMRHPEGYKRFLEVFVKSLDENKIKPYKEWLENSEGKMSDEDMLKEITADFSGEMFNDPKIMRRIFEEDRTVAKWIYDTITEMITKIKEAYVVSTSLKDLKAVQDEYVKLMREARLKDARPDKPGMKFSSKKDMVSYEYPNDNLRESITNVRGGWTVDKIHKELKGGTMRSDIGKNRFNRAISQFESPEEFAENLFFHGTAGYIPKGLRPGSAIGRNDFKSGGYDEVYHTISLSKSKDMASNFTGDRPSGSVYPVILKRGANVIERKDISDSIELEDILVDLWEQGVDAVKIGDWSKKFSEQEIAVLNPRALVLGEPEHFRVFNKERFENPTISEIKKMYDEASKFTYDYLGRPTPKLTQKLDDGSGMKFSTKRDSDGKLLTKEQDAFFKDSKARDADGNLLKVYHGSFGVGKFFEFNTDTIFLTTDSFVASKYSSAERIGKENVHYYSVYANLENPLVVDASKRIEGTYDVTIKSNPYTGKNTIELSRNGETAKTITTYNPDDFAKWFGENKATQFLNGISKAKQTKDAWGNKYHKYSAKGVQTKYSYPSAHDAIEWNGSKYTADELAKVAKAKGYDGVIINNVIDDLSFSETGTSATNVIAFRSNQVKLTTNLNPTTNPDIRFSMKRGMDDGNARLEAERKLLKEEANSKHKKYTENANEIIDAEVGETGAWVYAKDIVDKGIGRHLDIQRIVDYGFKKSAEGRKWFKEAFEDNFYKSKGEYTKSVKSQTNTLYDEVVKKRGIWKGSKESAGMQQIGEGMKLVKDGKEWKAVEYTLEDLKKDFDYTMKNGKKAWENIVEAEKVTRKMYDDYVKRINDSLRKIYPNVEANVEDIYRRAMKAKLESGNLVHSISRGNQGVVQKVDGDQITVHFKNKETGKEATVVMDRKDLMNEKHARELEDATVGKRLYPRQNYYRHFSEMQGGFLVGLDNIVNGATNIDPRLIDISRQTQPNSKFSGFLQHRGKGTDYLEDAVGGMLEYIPQAEYKINIEPNIPVLRKIIKELQEATVDSKNANDLIDNLIHVANDLAGKSNPLDRLWADYLNDKKGRIWLNRLSAVSNRVRANAVMGNMNTMIAQFFNFPNVVAYTMQNAKGTGGKGIAEGIQDALKAYAGNREAQAILNKSMFLQERYLDRSFRRFDKGIAGSADQLFSYSMELGDKIVADGAFLTFYRQNIAKGMSEADAVLKADELTRKSVAGRGIGEMPLSQKSKTVKLLMPFQVEVRNSINVLKEMGVSKDPYALAGIFVGMFGTSMLMNIALEETTGRKIGLDPYGMILDAIEDEDAKSIPYRLVGNFMTNYPGGSYIADVLKGALGLDSYVMRSMFKDQDPSRFGTGNIALDTIGKPVGTALKQMSNPKDTETNIDLLNTASMFLPKYGGKQIERTVRGLQDMALLPKEKLNVNSGASLEKRKLPASYTATGMMRFPIEKTPLNYALAPTLGVYATKQGKDYITKDRQYLREEQTAKVEKSADPIGSYEKIIYQRAIEKYKREVKEIKKNPDWSDKKKNKEIVEKIRERIKVVKDSGYLTDQQKKEEVLKLQGEILKYK